MFFPNACWRLICSGLVLTAFMTTLAAQDAKKDDFQPSAAVLKLIEGLQKQEEPNLDKAITEVKALVKSAPTDKSAKLILIQLIEGRGMQLAQDSPAKAAPYFLEAASTVRKFIAEEKNLLDIRPFRMLGETVFYNEACSLAVEKKADAAMASLKECLALGANDNLLTQLTADKDLDILRNRDDFKAMVKELTTGAVDRARKEFADMAANMRSFPFNFELKNLDGKTVKLSDYKGKYLIVDIWGTWCPPCRAEIPHFIELLDKYKPKGLEIVGINYEHADSDKEKVETIKKFNKEFKVPYTCLLGDEKTQDQVPDFQGYPTTLFLDRSGKVRMMIVGGEPLYRLEAAVEALMNSDKGAEKAGE